MPQGSVRKIMCPCKLQIHENLRDFSHRQRVMIRLCESIRVPRRRFNKLSVGSTWLSQRYIEYAYG